MDEKRVRLRLNGIGNLLFLVALVGVTVSILGAFFTDAYTWQFKTFIASLALMGWSFVFVSLSKAPLKH